MSYLSETKEIAGRFWLTGTIYDEVITVRTVFDATKATANQIRHVEGFYSLNHPRRAEVISANEIKLHKVFKGDKSCAI